MASKEQDMVQYCYNPQTKEIVEGDIPPSVHFIPIIGYFERGTDPLVLQKQIEEIAKHQEYAIDYDQYEEEESKDDNAAKE